MKNDWHLIPCVEAGLGHPCIGVAAFYTLHLQMNAVYGLNNIGGLLSPGKLLAPASGAAHDRGPFLGRFPLGGGAFGPAVYARHLAPLFA